MKKFKSLKLFFFLFILIFGYSLASQKLYVGTEAEFEPFEYMQDGKVVGFDIDLIREISKLINKDIQIDTMKFDGLLPALQAKKIDVIIAGMTVTDERKKFVNFSDTYYISEQMIVLNKESNINIKSFDDLPNKTVGVVLGYTADIIVSEIKNVKVMRYNATSEAIMALKSKKIDAIVIDSEPAKKYSNKNPELLVLNTDAAKEEYAIAMRKEETELLEEINKAIKTLKENGKYDELMSKYFD